jgi:hypothetical protein
VWETCQYRVDSRLAVDRLSEIVRLQVTLAEGYASSMTEAESFNHFCSKLDANMKEHRTSTLQITYTPASFEPDDAGRIEQELDRAFDLLFEATLADDVMIEESSEVKSLPRTRG